MKTLPLRSHDVGMNYKDLFKVKKILPLIFILSILMGCAGSGMGKHKNPVAVPTYPTISYLAIKLGANGELPSNPYVLRFKNKDKTIVFCGTNHLPFGTGIDDPMFKKIIVEFDSLKPNVCVNEGGDLSGKFYASSEDAVTRNGEIGLVKILADSLHIATKNGDPATSLEFAALLRRFTVSELLGYIATERFMWGIDHKGEIKIDSLEKAYRSFIGDYIVREGLVHLTPHQQTFEYFKSSYQQLVHRPFDLLTLEPTNPFDSTTKFQEVGRASKEFRDQYLLQTIDSLIGRYDKVFVVFGGWHLLTCSPGLKQIIDRAGRR